MANPVQPPNNNVAVMQNLELDFHIHHLVHGHNWQPLPNLQIPVPAQQLPVNLNEIFQLDDSFELGDAEHLLPGKNGG